MHTPSGRFQTSTRLCLSISDFHPKSFNPAWEVSTILLGLQSFMNSDEITTGSINNSEAERRAFASRTRWWNSTGGGSTKKEIPGVSGSNAKGVGNVKAGDGGQKFRKEWAELDEENWKWMKENRIEPKTGVVVPDPNAPATSSCAPGADALRRRAGSANTNAAGQAVVEGAQQVADAGGSWVARHKALTAFIALMAYVVVARLVSI
jgi:ubiquitin-conjugating enzyme E2 J2